MSLNESALNTTPLNAQSVQSSYALVKGEISGRKYTCIITGAADGLDDAIIPLSNISIRMDETNVSSLSVVCPDGVGYADSIINRKNGSLKLLSLEIYNDGTESLSDSQEYAITAISSARGSKSFSVSITAQTTLFNTTPKIIILSGVSYISQNQSGNTRLRASPDKDILPGDTVILDDLSELLVNTVTTTISARLSSMEITDG